MRGRLLGLLLAAAVGFPAGASAAPVLVMGTHGRVHRGIDPFLAAWTATPAPSSTGAPAAARRRTPSPAAAPRTTPASASARRATAARAPAHRKHKPKPPSVTSELARLLHGGQITPADYGRYSASWAAAGTAAKHLRGTRAAELKAVMTNLQAMAASRAFSSSRLPAIFLTLDRNRQWWTTGPLPSSGQRIEFTGSNLVWEYYPGQGIELQVLATFGRADGLYSAGRSAYPQMRALLDEMIPLAAERGGGLAWEYYFRFDGGLPPWTSAMSQGTGLEALTRAARAFGAAAGPSGSASSYLQIAQQALPIFSVAPPAGVRVSTAAGARYLQYTFAPSTDIINAFLQSLIGLYDYGQLSGDPQAQQLFAAGTADAQAELPSFDTGAWSLYQPGIEDDLNYHILVTGFLDQLCARTSAPVYCTTATHFHAYLKTPPTIRLLSTRATGKRRFNLRFALSKYSHVGVVITRGQQTVLQTSASFAYGTDAFAVPPLRAGSYQVVLTATDLPGNFARIVASLQVSRPRPATSRGSNHPSASHRTT